MASSEQSKAVRSGTQSQSKKALYMLVSYFD